MTYIHFLTYKKTIKYQVQGEKRYSGTTVIQVHSKHVTMVLDKAWQEPKLQGDSFKINNIQQHNCLDKLLAPNVTVNNSAMH